MVSGTRMNIGKVISRYYDNLTPPFKVKLRNSTNGHAPGCTLVTILCPIRKSLQFLSCEFQVPSRIAGLPLYIPCSIRSLRGNVVHIWTTPYYSYILFLTLSDIIGSIYEVLRGYSIGLGGYERPSHLGSPAVLKILEEYVTRTIEGLQLITGGDPANLTVETDHNLFIRPLDLALIEIAGSLRTNTGKEIRRVRVVFEE